MTQSARVHSIDALRQMHAALADFSAKAQEALGSAALEVQRVLDEMHDRLKFWQRQVEKCHEDVNRARADLAHRRALREGASTTGCVEQEIALRRAQQRLREAEEKLIVTRRWLIMLPQAISEYEGPSRHLAGMLDANLRHSLALLQNKIDTLDAYTTQAPPGPALPPPAKESP
jgi:hypothetical protein